MYNINSRNRKKGRNLLLVGTLLLVMCLFIVSCGSSKAALNQSMAVAPAASGAAMEITFSEEMSKDQVSPVSPEQGFGESNGASDGKSKSETVPASDLQKDRKMIMDGSVSLETLKFESSIEAMDKLIEKFGGFAETRTVRGKSNNSRALRSANYVIRIPAESFRTVLEDMGNIGTVLESNSKGTDITDQYYDSETRVKTLKVQEQTLLDILAKATKLEDVITLESRLSDIRYEIEGLENTLKNYDRLVAFSRINVYIQEVDDVTETRPLEKKLNERISSAFRQSLREFRIGFEDFVVSFVGSWITLLFLGVIVVIVLLILKNKKKKKILTKKSQNSETENNELPK